MTEDTQIFFFHVCRVSMMRFYSSGVPLLLYFSNNNNTAEFIDANEAHALDLITAVHLEADQLQPHMFVMIETVMCCLMTVPGVLLIGLHNLLMTTL